MGLGEKHDADCGGWIPAMAWLEVLDEREVEMRLRKRILGYGCIRRVGPPQLMKGSRSLRYQDHAAH